NLRRRRYTLQGDARRLVTTLETVPELLAGPRVPAADHAVAAAVEQRAAVGKEGGRPDRQSRSDQRAFELALTPVDDGDRAADAGGGDEAAVARQGHRDDGRLRRLDLAGELTRIGEHIDLAVGAGSDDLAVGRDRDRVERCRQRGDD